MSSKSIATIIRDYQQKKELPKISIKPPGIVYPLIMNNLVFTCVRNIALKLLPQYRKVLLCFEHFTYDSICDEEFLHATHKKCPKPCMRGPPRHCIILQVKFLGINKFQNLGTLGYHDLTDREIIGESIKEYIEDLSRCDLHVVASCSSGKFEILTLLIAMDAQTDENGMLSYPILHRGLVIHLFDPSWMMRKLKGEFINNDIMFNYNKYIYLASYNDIEALFNIEALKPIFGDECYNILNRTTNSAAKIFSKTVANFFEGFDGADKTAITLQKAEATKLLTLFIDILFDTFNSHANAVPLKALIRPMTLDSEHWDMWKMIVPLLENMRFLSRDCIAKAGSMNCQATDGRPAPPPQVHSDNSEDKENRRILPTPNTNKGMNTLEKKKKKRKNKKVDPPVVQKPINQPNVVDDKLIYYLDNEYVRVGVKQVKATKDPCLKSQDLFDKLFTILKSSLNTVAVADNERYRLHDLQAKLKDFKTRHEDLRLRFGRDPATWATFDNITFRNSEKLGRIVHFMEDSATFFEKTNETFDKGISDLDFLDLSVFKMWMYSIAGIKNVFFFLNNHHMDAFDTKIINCDAIHRFVSEIREHNGFPPYQIVEQSDFECPHDYNICVLALSDDCNVTVASYITEKISKNVFEKKHQKLMAAQTQHA